MRRLAALLVFFLCPVFLCPVLAFPTPPVLRSVQLVTPAVAWGFSAGGVYRSTDSGGKWQNLTPALPGRVASFGGVALDARHAWLNVTPTLSVAQGSQEQAPQLYRTADAGRTWRRSQLYPRGFGAVRFLDALHGVATVGLDAGLSHIAFVVLTSQDGGVSWQKVNSARYAYMTDPELRGGELPDVSGLGEVSLLSRRDVLVTGSSDTLGQPYLFVSRDGGHHFQAASKQLPLTASERDQNTVSLFKVVSSGPGRPTVLLGSFRVYAAQGRFRSGHLAVFVSGTAGRSWTRLGTRNAPAPLAVYSCAFADARNGWAWAETTQNDRAPGRLYRTLDGGRHWSPVLAPFRRDTLLALGRSGQNGLALSTQGLYGTVNGGLSWQRLRPVFR